jgi:hypothetical protein
MNPEVIHAGDLPFVLGLWKKCILKGRRSEIMPMGDPIEQRIHLCPKRAK